MNREQQLQCRNRDIDIKNKYMDTKGGRKGWGELGDWGYLYTLLILYIK